jgi:hypothetical protein
MNFDSLFSLFIKAFGTYETDKQLLEAGQTVASPAVQVGTLNGGPLFARVQLSTNQGFSDTPVPSINPALAQVTHS